jgi:hypothetical protein
MALALIARGWRLMADETCALGYDGPRESLLIWPSYPEIRARPDVVARFSQFSPSEQPTPSGRRILALDEVFEPRPLRPTALVALNVARGGAAEALYPLTGATKLQTLMNLARFVDSVAAGEARRASAALAALAPAMRIFEFRRRLQNLERVDESAQQLEAALDSEIAAAEQDARSTRVNAAHLQRVACGGNRAGGGGQSRSRG